MATGQRSLSHFIRTSSQGTAAIEFAAVASMLLLGVLNAVDVGFYLYHRMEVENAAQAGAQAAWTTCYDSSSMLPATMNCAGLNAAITAAIESTSLGTSVSLASGYPTEGYYCVTTSNGLQTVGSLTSKPTNCSATGNSNGTPSDYIQVGVTYGYAPLFGVTVMSALGINSITMTSWMRLS
jgi:Flp pilus assembly protein TadG